MDKENGENTEGGTNSSKLSNPPDPSTLLDAASLFGKYPSVRPSPPKDLFLSAYWPRNDSSNTANAANLFAAAGGAYGLGGHPAMPFGLLPPTSGRGVPSYSPSSTTAAAAYSNAYTNTLSVAASQAASLGIPAASKQNIPFFTQARLMADKNYEFTSR